MQVHDETVVVVSDADDILLVPGCSPDVILSKFLNGPRTPSKPFSGSGHRAPMLYSAERDNWPRAALIDGFLQSLYNHVVPDAVKARNTSFLFLNGGLQVKFKEGSHLCFSTLFTYPDYAYSLSSW